MLSVVVEEVLPRPDAGLLKRMLRMTDVPVGVLEGGREPILHLRASSECHLSVGLAQVQGAEGGVRVVGPVGIGVRPSDGDWAELDVNCERVGGAEHIATAFWNLSSHGSTLLTRAAPAPESRTSLLPVEFRMVFLVYRGGGPEAQEVEVKKTVLACLRTAVATLDVEPRYQHSDTVLNFVLSDMELVSVPSLVWFLKASA
ncbi:unnamed protein product [Ostreobium quekettii]|uniref:Uncharacterized protein n=1 Tax=Ostreobium quekettii TaxID=121088 RepID=A0A8S1J4L2_9CHLO|nr:unnamed protein product [Ostreobium quekettii]